MNGVLETLTAFSGLASEMLWKAALVFLRIGAVMALLPAFGEQMVPQRVRLVLTLGFSAVVFSAVAPELPDLTDGKVALLGIEVIVGLALGFALRLFVHALQIAGAIAAQATSLSQLAAGTGPEPQPAIGQFLVIGGLALATAAGLHVRVAQMLILTYQVFPAGVWPDPAAFVQWEIARVASGFALAFSIAAPFVIASVLYNLALGVINRAMPALMVTMIGAPVQVLGGLVLLALSGPTALFLWHRAMVAFLTAPTGTLP